MGTTGIRGTQVKDETIESVDLASGSIRVGELNADAVSNQATIDSVDTTNDMLLIYDANNDALKKVAPTNLGVGGSGSPGGSDTQVQYNNGGSFGGAAQLIYDDSNHRLGVGSTSAPDYTLDVAGDIGVDQYIYHNGDGNTLINFADDKIILKAGGKAMITMEEKASAPHEITLNDGGNNIDFVVKGNGSNEGNPGFFFDASNNRVGINGVGSPSVELDVSGDVNFDGAAVFNESSADKDFRVESNNNTHMFFIDAGANRIGIGNNSPQTVLDITDPLDGTGAEVDAIIRLRSKKDVGIKLISDTDNSGENDNPFIDFYQDGSTDSTGRSNRLGTIAMEGDAATTFTGSIGNAFFMDAFHPNSGHSSRPLQLANASTNGGHSARITLEGTNGYVGMHTATPTSPVHAYGDVSGTPVMLVDNDNSSAGHGLKVTSDGTGSGTNLFDIESASTTVFRVRGDGRVGIGKVTSLPAAVLTVSSSNTDGDIAVAHKIQHIGDSDTYVEFGDDEIQLAAGGRTFIKIEESSTDKLTINNGGLDIDLKVSGENQANLIRTDAENDRVGIATSSPSTLLDVSGSAKANTFVTTPALTDLGSGTATHLTSSNGVHFLDADSVTLASGKTYHEIFLAPGSTNGQHIQLAITSSANNPVRLVGDSGGDKAQGTVSFSGAPSDGQTVSFSNGTTTYVVTWDAASPAGNFAVASATSVVAGIGGAGTANDMGFVMYNAIDTGISAASWPFTLVGSYGGGSTVTLSQTAAGTNGNQTITENSDNTTATGFSGGTALVEGTLNSTYGVALAGTSATGGLLQGAHLIYDSNSEKWQIIAGTQLTS